MSQRNFVVLTRTKTKWDDCYTYQFTLSQISLPLITISVTLSRVCRSKVPTLPFLQLCQNIVGGPTLFFFFFSRSPFLDTTLIYQWTLLLKLREDWEKNTQTRGFNFTLLFRFLTLPTFSCDRLWPWKLSETKIHISVSHSLFGSQDRTKKVTGRHTGTCSVNWRGS